MFSNNKLEYILIYVIMERKSIQIQYKKPSAKKVSPQNTRNHVWVAPSKQLSYFIEYNCKYIICFIDKTFPSDENLFKVYMKIRSNGNLKVIQ